MTFGFVSLKQADVNADDKKKGKQEKVKKCIRTAAGTSWEDQSLLEWDTGTLEFALNIQYQDATSTPLHSANEGA